MRHWLDRHHRADFSSHLPCGRRRPRRTIKCPPDVFQPTPPVREVTIGLIPAAEAGEFQSTPPVRKVTTLRDVNQVMYVISIHTSRAGGDSNYYQKFSSHFIHHQQFSSHLLLPLSKFLKINNYPHRILPHFQTSSSANPPEFSCSLPIRTYHKISVSSTAIPRSTPTCSTFVL